MDEKRTLSTEHGSWLAKYFLSKQKLTYTRIGRKIDSLCQILLKNLAINGPKTDVLVKIVKI